MYIMTDLKTHTKSYLKTPDDVYDFIWGRTGNHKIAEEMECFAELNPYGDNWTNEDIGFDLYIEDEDEEDEEWN